MFKYQLKLLNNKKNILIYILFFIYLLFLKIEELYLFEVLLPVVSIFVFSPLLTIEKNISWQLIKITPYKKYKIACTRIFVNITLTYALTFFFIVIYRMFVYEFHLNEVFQYYFKEVYLYSILNSSFFALASIFLSLLLKGSVYSAFYIMMYYSAFLFSNSFTRFLSYINLHYLYPFSSYSKFKFFFSSTNFDVFETYKIVFDGSYNYYKVVLCLSSIVIFIIINYLYNEIDLSR